MQPTVTPLKITAYSDDKFNIGTGSGSFEVIINPDSYNYSHSVNFSDQKQVAEGAGNTLKFNTIGPETVSFDIIFDGTPVFKEYTINVMRQIKSLKKHTNDVMRQIKDLKKHTNDVTRQINRFKELTYNYNGEIQRNNYLELSWGTFLFYGYLTKLDIKYTLFKRNGDPLRAKASVAFNGVVREKLMSKKANKQSSGVSHIKRAKVTDTLPLFCNEVYRDPELYLDVAYANNLDTFRELPVGGLITFPALKK